jgi:hypothetical protein
MELDTWEEEPLPFIVTPFQEELLKTKLPKGPTDPKLEAKDPDQKVSFSISFYFTVYEYIGKKRSKKGRGRFACTLSEG